MIETQIIEKEQFGFRKGCGCEMQIARLLINCRTDGGNDKNRDKYILFIDFKAAFDCGVALRII